MRLKVHYYTAMTRTPSEAILETHQWIEIRGQTVLRGQQKINKRLVNRSIAKDEIIKTEEVR
jgi:hypothetical protein